MAKRITVCAGIDTGKNKLDIAIKDISDQLQVANTSAGHERLSVWLRQYRVKRVGIEASGGYEQAVVVALRRKGFVVVVFQPAQVRAYAKFHLQRAKNDKIDAALIAACTAEVETIHAAPDPRMMPFAEQLTMIDQIGEDVACLKNRLETCRDARIRQIWREEITRLTKRQKSELKALVAAIRQHRDLAERLSLIESVDGIGLPTVVAILVRLPEIGRITREQAAALAGVAPYDDDSGQQVGIRHIDGGRERLRRALYTAALPASFRWNPQLIALYRRLMAAGKGHKRALIACARAAHLRQHGRDTSNAVGAHSPVLPEPSTARTRIAAFVFSVSLSIRRPFLRPDPPLAMTPRAGGVKAGRHSVPYPRDALERPRLDADEHGVMIRADGTT